MAVATTLIAPPFLRRLFAGESGEPSDYIPDSVVEERPVRLE
jgi:hypothetical protein